MYENVDLLESECKIQWKNSQNVIRRRTSKTRRRKRKGSGYNILSREKVHQEQHELPPPASLISNQFLLFYLDDRILRRVLFRKFRNDAFNGDHRQRGKRPRMSLPVADQTGLLRERLAANVAFVGPLAGVNQHMLLLSGLPSELLAADRTRERLRARVHAHVGVEVAAAEPLAAGRAQHLLPGLVPHEMLLEILTRGHAAPADPADKFGLVVPVLDVGLEGVQVLAEVTANVADDRRRAAMVLLHVVVQRLLDLELLAAGVARVVVAARVQPYVVILQGALVVALVLAYAALVHLLLLLLVILLNVRDQAAL